MSNYSVVNISDVLVDVRRELQSAIKNHSGFNSAHEGYAVLLEEVDELWDHVKTNEKKRDVVAMRKEAAQVAAVAVRFMLDICDRSSAKSKDNDGEEDIEPKRPSLPIHADENDELCVCGSRRGDHVRSSYDRLAGNVPCAWRATISHNPIRDGHFLGTGIYQKKEVPR